jgi:hypothetical protein
MSEAGRTAGRKRDATGEAVPPRVDEVVSVPWSPRQDDRRALLVNERSTVFDRPLVVPVSEVVAAVDLTALGPAPTEWTHDLVHCRLVLVYVLASQLPRILWPAGIRSALGQLQPQPAGERRRPLADDDLAVLDWTWSLVWLLGEDDRAIVRGFMSGASLREIAAELQALQARGIGLGKAIGKSSVGGRYRALTTAWADDWNRRRHAIDRGTLEVWAAAARKQ